MEPECRRIGRFVLPAVRASIAELMKDRYGWKQKDIAAGLGIVQVAVSKYLNAKYSSDVLKMRMYIIKKGLSDKIAEELANGKHGREIDMKIDALCGVLIQSGGNGYA